VASLLFPTALTIALTGAALGLTLLPQRFVSTAGYIFFYAAVLGGTWFSDFLLDLWLFRGQDLVIACLEPGKSTRFLFRVAGVNCFQRVTHTG
jgi:hypothetical protein